MKAAKEWSDHFYGSPKTYNVPELVRDVQNDAIANVRRECEAEIKRLNAELAESRNETEGWITLATDARHERDEARGEASWLRVEIAALRAQQPAPVPQEPAESPIDKAAREAFERWDGGRNCHTPWHSKVEEWRESWRRVVAPFVKPEPPKPVKTDGELLEEATSETPIDDVTMIFGRVAALFLAKRAERDAEVRP